jgi:hypothetical protein
LAHLVARAAQEVTRLINERNEADFARKASQSGGSLTLVRAARRCAQLPRAAAVP